MRNLISANIPEEVFFPRYSACSLGIHDAESSDCTLYINLAGEGRRGCKDACSHFKSHINNIVRTNFRERTCFQVAVEATICTSHTLCSLALTDYGRLEKVKHYCRVNGHTYLPNNQHV